MGEVLGYLYRLADGISNTWLIGADFNVVLNRKDKIGGISM